MTVLLGHGNNASLVGKELVTRTFEQSAEPVASSSNKKSALEVFSMIIDQATLPL